jgi:hypothetical protein
MSRLAFPPEPLNQFARRWQILYEIDAKPREQHAFRHRAFEFSIVGRGLVTQNLASIGPGRQDIAFAGPLP